MKRTGGKKRETGVLQMISLVNALRYAQLLQAPEISRQTAYTTPKKVTY